MGTYSVRFVADEGIPYTDASLEIASMSETIPTSRFATIASRPAGTPHAAAIFIAPSAPRITLRVFPVWRTLVELQERSEDAPLQAVRKARVQIWNVH